MRIQSIIQQVRPYFLAHPFVGEAWGKVRNIGVEMYIGAYFLTSRRKEGKKRPI
jgi:hypothetical protein